MFGSNKKIKTQTKQHFDQNPVEAFTRSTGNTPSQGKDAISGEANDLWKQILGERPAKQHKKKHGELMVGEELDLRVVSQNENHANLEITPGIDYRREIVHGSERINHLQNSSLEQQIENILVELKQLTAASKELEIEFKNVVVEQRIVKAGKYHQSFLEWVVVIIRAARMRIEDASIWLATIKGKKNKKQSQNYWQMFKKHGTTFGLSNERVVATQTG